MNIQHQQNQQDGEFFVLDDQGQKVAKLTYYFIDAHSINANHTYVSERLRGQGVADKLYQALVQFVREHQLNLVPSCSYIERKWLRETR
ncbi:GNAT family N-acetyltransferase [Avibacterium sp. 21-599]|uniref:GNAT family N-acetyltransferase n=1 Tax=Avibacterium sp. 21-599 TaxID=2911528 RepID=UPI0022480808|nr:GNAT family N-acetyltransferase [Avibacterium sp. 21-599]MCW9717776.1 GNAT family N-acetyltransferase [Avibacterium sp. 21-599]